ncbi:DUF5677 domain-containing protein [Kitasatospora sp. NPDC058190]|uniref:DUF5677 domain-containing protein n=1 Tax=Kitasatospora sp. NPDC058190 TaxID=3346371 RepID=UPI0036DA8B62
MAETAKGAHRAVAHLVKLFNEVGAGDIEVDRALRDVFLVAWGWWARVIRSGHAVSLLSLNNVGPESSPIVRSIAEHTMLLVWLADSGDEAVAALTEEHEAHRKALMESVQKAEAEGWQIPDCTDEPVLPPSGDEHPLRVELKFETLCRLFNEPGLYVIYRLLSGYVHPSLTSSETYLHQDLETGRGSIATTPRPSDSEIIQAAYCMIQATRTIGALCNDERFGKAAARAEELLGHVPGLPTRVPAPAPVEKPVPLQFMITAPRLETSEKLADVVTKALASSGLVKVGKPQQSEKKKRVLVDLTEPKSRP